MADAANLPPSRSGDQLAATLAIALIPGIGSARVRTLLRTFGGALEAIRAPQRAILELEDFTPVSAAALRACRPEAGLEILEQLRALGARGLLADDPDYPLLLAETSDAPPVLFAWGELTQLHRIGVAVVGSRECTEYGSRATRTLVSAIAARPEVAVVSGMARGIDAVAHEAALDVGGASVGVLGNGFGVVYPPRNRALYDRMLRKGCLVTEMPPGVPPHRGAFPRRNRIVSGLSRAVVVAEAAVGSGALITADFALDQGRVVLAVPGPITSPTSTGCNKLIQQGAKPVLVPGDILEEIGITGIGDWGLEIGNGPTNPQSPISNPPRAAPPDLDDLQRSLWDAMGAEVRHVDALVAIGGGDTGKVLTALTELELRGVVRQEAGMRFGLR